MSVGNCSYINNIILLDCGIDYHPTKGTTEVRENYCLHYVISGNGTLIVNGQKFSVCAGQSFLIFPYVPVLYYPEDKDWAYTWVDIGGVHADDVFHRTGFSVKHPVSHKYINDKLLFLYRDILDTKEECLKMSYTYRLLAHYIQNFPSDSDSFVRRTYTQEAIAFINGNLRLPITGQTIADYLGISRVHLYRQFTNEVGMTINEYIRTARLNRACHLLTTTNFSVKTISSSVGFTNPNYFNEVFHKYIGTPPGEYRKARTQKSL